MSVYKRSALIGQGSNRLSYAEICQRKGQPPLLPSADHAPFYPGQTSKPATAIPLGGGKDA